MMCDFPSVPGSNPGGPTNNPWNGIGEAAKVQFQRERGALLTDSAGFWENLHVVEFGETL